MVEKMLNKEAMIVTQGTLPVHMTMTVGKFMYDRTTESYAIGWKYNTGGSTDRIPYWNASDGRIILTGAYWTGPELGVYLTVEDTSKDQKFALSHVLMRSPLWVGREDLGATPDGLIGVSGGLEFYVDRSETASFGGVPLSTDGLSIGKDAEDFYEVGQIIQFNFAPPSRRVFVGGLATSLTEVA